MSAVGRLKVISKQLGLSCNHNNMQKSFCLSSPPKPTLSPNQNLIPSSTSVCITSFHDCEFIKVTICGQRKNIAVLTISRPKALNALSEKVLDEICTVLEHFDSDGNISCSIITGSISTFSVGADLKQLGTADSSVELYKIDFPRHWNRVAATKKPVIAAVNGYCFGGGCEIALASDIILAGENAMFSQPEIKVGLIPGGGGTQRLIRTVGKSKAMEMVLTGRPITAEEALRFGLVSAVYPTDQLLEKAIEMAEQISVNSSLITQIAKECVNKANEMPLSEGLGYEKRMFQFLFDTNDRREGMSAFIDKRKPSYTNR